MHENIHLDERFSLVEQPLVSIGMPLYNNERTIARAIESLLSQSFSNFELIVSDDGSRDATVELVERIAQRDARVRVVRQPTNLNYGNFRFVLDAARAPYFMFAAGDDWWEPTFVERCLDALAAAPESICATSRTLMHPESAPPYLSMATAPLRGPVGARLGTYLRSPVDNSRMYGLYRTDAARSSFPSDNFFAYDWAFCARTLLLGEYVEVPEVLLHREVTEQRRYFDYAKRDGATMTRRVFPLLAMSRDLLAVETFPKTRRVLRHLAWLNGFMHAEYVAVHYPRLDRLYGRMVRHLLAATEASEHD